MTWTLTTGSTMTTRGEAFRLGLLAGLILLTICMGNL